MRPPWRSAKRDRPLVIGRISCLRWCRAASPSHHARGERDVAAFTDCVKTQSMTKTWKKVSRESKSPVELFAWRRLWLILAAHAW